MDPLPRKVLLQHGRCCGNGCYNCPYIPRHVRGATEYAKMFTCHACGGELMDMRGKMVCSRCFTINETCCEGGRCHVKNEHDTEKSPNYRETDDECF